MKGSSFKRAAKHSEKRSFRPQYVSCLARQSGKAGCNSSSALVRLHLDNLIVFLDNLGRTLLIRTSHRAVAATQTQASGGPTPASRRTALRPWDSTRPHDRYSASQTAVGLSSPAGGC
eukprot:6190136-Pleurochrysis_carterae.AAC.1